MPTVESYRLRDWIPSDLPRLAEIDRECFPPEIACAVGQLQVMMRGAAGFALVAEVTGEGIVGFVVASRLQPKLGHIITLDVLSRFRRRGIGTSLMQAAEQRLAGQGAETLRLETPEFSHGAQALYRKLGFRRVGFIGRYYSNGSGGWVMKKELPLPHVASSSEGPASGERMLETANRGTKSR